MVPGVPLLAEGAAGVDRLFKYSHIV